jgi:hypothetical protein
VPTNPTPKPPEETWLPPPQAALARSLSARLVRRWIEAGWLPTSRVGGNGYHLVNLADLDALLAASRIPAQAGPLAAKKAR